MAGKSPSFQRQERAPTCYTLAAMSARIRRPITRCEITVAGLFAIAWTLAWVATGVALRMAR